MFVAWNKYFVGRNQKAEASRGNPGYAVAVVALVLTKEVASAGKQKRYFTAVVQDATRRVLIFLLKCR